jgi:uncharacterized protein (TIRG00374 family)
VKSGKVLLGIALSAALLGWLLWRVDLAALGHQLRETQWGWALVTCALSILGLWTRARRWYYLFPPGSHPPALVRAVMIGYMGNNVLPLRAGEILRVYVVSRHWRLGFWLPLATLVVERILDGLAVVLILGILTLLMPVPPMLKWAALAILAIDIIATGVLAAIAAAPERCRDFITRLTRRWPGLERRLIGVFQMFVRGLAGVRTPAHAVPIVCWSVLVWLLSALAAWTAMFAARIDLPFLAAWAVLAFVGLGISLPSAPGYIGVFHTAAVLALGMFGVVEPAAFGYALLFHACGFVPITLVGWICLVREQMSLGDAIRQPAPAIDG